MSPPPTLLPPWTSGSKGERKGEEGGEGKREGGRGRVAKMTGREERARIEGKKGGRINRKQKKEEERGEKR